LASVVNPESVSVTERHTGVKAGPQGLDCNAIRVWV